MSRRSPLESLLCVGAACAITVALLAPQAQAEPPGRIEGAIAVDPAAPPTGARFFDAASVRAAFAKGAPILETGDYKIHASRRVEPGEAEVHLRDTDVIYVLDGAATFVTGGEVVEPRDVAAGEVRGSAIEGGEARELAPGEVVVVPQGTPHWFRAVRGAFVYYVVKVTDGAPL